jgi:hypothetical protein
MKSRFIDIIAYDQVPTNEDGIYETWDNDFNKPNPLPVLSINSDLEVYYPQKFGDAEHKFAPCHLPKNTNIQNILKKILIHIAEKKYVEFKNKEPLKGSLFLKKAIEMAYQNQARTTSSQIVVGDYSVNDYANTFDLLSNEFLKYGFQNRFHSVAGIPDGMVLVIPAPEEFGCHSVYPNGEQSIFVIESSVDVLFVENLLN